MTVLQYSVNYLLLPIVSFFMVAMEKINRIERAFQDTVYGAYNLDRYFVRERILGNGISAHLKTTKNSHLDEPTLAVVEHWYCQILHQDTTRAQAALNFLQNQNGPSSHITMRNMHLVIAFSSSQLILPSPSPSP